MIYGMLRTRNNLIKLENKKTYIGRSAACEIRLESQSVSKKHAVIEFTDGDHIELRDLQSRNATFVNKQRIHNSCFNLCHGDILRFGFNTETHRFELPHRTPLGSPTQTQLSTNAKRPNLDLNSLKTSLKEKMEISSTNKIRMTDTEREPNPFIKQKRMPSASQSMNHGPNPYTPAGFPLPLPSYSPAAHRVERLLAKNQSQEVELAKLQTEQKVILEHELERLRRQLAVETERNKHTNAQVDTTSSSLAKALEDKINNVQTQLNSFIENQNSATHQPPMMDEKTTTKNKYPIHTISQLELEKSEIKTIQEIVNQMKHKISIFTKNTQCFPDSTTFDHNQSLLEQLKFLKNDLTSIDFNLSHTVLNHLSPLEKTQSSSLSYENQQNSIPTTPTNPLSSFSQTATATKENTIKSPINHHSSFNNHQKNVFTSPISKYPINQKNAITSPIPVPQQHNVMTSPMQNQTHDVMTSPMHNNNIPPLSKKEHQLQEEATTFVNRMTSPIRQHRPMFAPAAAEEKERIKILQPSFCLNSQQIDPNTTSQSTFCDRTTMTKSCLRTESDEACNVLALKYYVSDLQTNIYKLTDVIKGKNGKIEKLMGEDWAQCLSNQQDQEERMNRQISIQSRENDELVRMFSQLQQKIEKHKDISASHVDISNFVEKYSKQIQLEKNKFKEYQRRKSESNRRWSLLSKNYEQSSFDKNQLQCMLQQQHEKFQKIIRNKDKIIVDLNKSMAKLSGLSNEEKKQAASYLIESLQNYIKLANELKVKNDNLEMHLHKEREEFKFFKSKYCLNEKSRIQKLENEIGELKQHSGCERVAKLERAVMGLQTKNANLVNTIKEQKEKCHKALEQRKEIDEGDMFNYLSKLVKQKDEGIKHYKKKLQNTQLDLKVLAQKNSTLETQVESQEKNLDTIKNRHRQMSHILQTTQAPDEISLDDDLEISNNCVENSEIQEHTLTLDGLGDWD